MGVIGCPNLPFDTAYVKETIVDTNGYGCLLSAVKGQGAFVRRMEVGGLGPPRKVSHEKPEEIRIIQPSNSSYDFETNAKLLIGRARTGLGRGSGLLRSDLWH